MAMPWSPEWQVILASTQMPVTDEARRTITQALAHPSFDWDRFTARVCAHGVAPLVAAQLQKMAMMDHLPPHVRAFLQSAYYRNAARNTLLFGVVQEVLQACHHRGIAVILLKGAALAETVYPHPAVRPMGDIDLLVRPEALEAVDDSLTALGYRFVDHGRPKAYWRAQHYHLTFQPPPVAPLVVSIEVHWALERASRPFRIDLDGLWQRAMPATIAGIKTRILAPEDQLLHLCVHLCKHAGISSADGGLSWRLRALSDLVAVLSCTGPTFDWEACVRRAQAWGVTSYIYIPLALTCELSGVRIPASALAALQPPGFDARLLGWARDELLDDPGPLLPNLLRLWGGKGLRQRTAVVRKVLSPAVLARRYDATPTVRYGYYPRRLWDLVRRYGPVLWRLIRRDPVLIAQAERKAQLAAWLYPFIVRDHSARPPSAQSP
jgi:putative nucleotidyltransferase-like protein